MQTTYVGLFFLLAGIVVLVIVAGPVIIILRDVPGYRKLVAERNQMKADGRRIVADYERAGLTKRPLKGGFTGTLSGVAFTHEVIIPVGKYSMPYARLTGSGTLKGEFAIRRSDGFFISFAREVKTGDLKFDREFYLQGGSQEYVRAIFSDARNRDAVQVLFGLGFESLALADGKIVAVRRNPPILLELDALRTALKQFATLREVPHAA